jgi:DNA sulfur modification protein DndC
MIGGRTIATFPENDRKCQQMLKANPLTKLKKSIESEFVQTTGIKDARVCVMSGLRLSESSNRQSRMNARGDNASFPVWNEGSKQWSLSPIANYTTDDVFETIGRVRSGMVTTYSDFEDLVRVYRDSAAGECMVNLYANGKSQKQTSCGSRHGCYTCTVSGKKDESMENFLKNDAYAYMRPLNQFREYIVSRHYDWGSRNWLARSVDDDGMIAISPNSYSPDFCLQLLRYALTIDAREQEWAHANQTTPRFQILSLPKILGIEALWNRYGYQRTLQACQTYKEIFIDGKRYDFPETLVYAEKKPLPPAVKVPFADDEFWSSYNGLFDIELAFADPDNACNHVINTDDEFTIDEEGAELFFEFELDSALAYYHHSDRAILPASGLHYLLRLGVISIFKNGQHDWDKMLRIGNQLSRHNLREILNQPEALIKRLSH